MMVEVTQFPRWFGTECSPEKCAMIITFIRMSDFFGLYVCVICWDLLQMLCKNDSSKAEVKPQKGDSEDETQVEREDAVQKVCNATGCSDMDLVSHILEVEDYNVESAIFAILQVKEGEGTGECRVCHLGLWVTVMLVLGTAAGQVGFVCCHLSLLCSGRLFVRTASIQLPKIPRTSGKRNWLTV